jgi:uncharacterized protein
MLRNLLRRIRGIWLWLTGGSSLPEDSATKDSSMFNLEGLSPALLPLMQKIEEEYHRNPPSIAVIGLSGVGKSTTINAMFNTNLTVSATTRGTTKFESIRARLDIQRSDAKGNSAYLQVYDAPGLGEDIKLDPEYLRMYEDVLPKCDVALWIVAARNRALALDQMYLKVDLVDPLDWNQHDNLPSDTQKEHIDKIVRDRSSKLADAFGRPVTCIAYSSTRYYRLMQLYEHIIANAPEKRRWLFELVRAFDASDWLKQASGLSDQEKRDIVAKFERENPALA